MELPKKDKNGKNRLSYSQISLFKRDKKEFYKNYILGEKFKGNAYTKFGSKVGNALQNNNFDFFEDYEADVLKTATRLFEFEKFITLEYDEFNIYGYIDSNSEDLKTIIDYKTGGSGKIEKYKDKDYNQLQIYALAIKQQYKVDVEYGSVEYITRKGNAYRGEKLKVSNEPIKKVEIDLSLERLKFVYWDVLKTANEISEFYKKYK